MLGGTQRIAAEAQEKYNYTKERTNIESLEDSIGEKQDVIPQDNRTTDKSGHR